MTTMMAAADFISRLTDCVLGTIVSLFLRRPKAGARTAAEEEEDADLISDLPDCLLGSIVSLLPPRAGARTAVLSRRWRHIWQSVPLDLDLDARDTDLFCISAQKMSLLLVLASRRGPIRSISADLWGAQPKEAYDIWVQALASTHIRDTLVLRFPVRWGVQTNFPSVPLYRLARSLRRLELHVCRLDIPGDGDGDGTTTLLLLPRLCSLHLSNVRVSEAALHRVLDGCTALRDLILFRIHGLRRLVLRSRTLTTLRIMPHVPMDDLSFKDAPNLESIDFMHMDLWRKPAIAQATAAHPNLQQVTLRMPLLYRYTASSIHKVRIYTYTILSSLASLTRPLVYSFSFDDVGWID